VAIDEELAHAFKETKGCITSAKAWTQRRWQNSITHRHHRRADRGRGANQPSFGRPTNLRVFKEGDPLPVQETRAINNDHLIAPAPQRRRHGRGRGGFRFPSPIFIITCEYKLHTPDGKWSGSSKSATRMAAPTLNSSVSPGRICVGAALPRADIQDGLWRADVWREGLAALGGGHGPPFGIPDIFQINTYGWHPQSGLCSMGIARSLRTARF